MTLNNAYKIYTVLNERQHQQAENGSDRLKELSMDNAIKELTYSLLIIAGWLWSTEESSVSFVASTGSTVCIRS